MATVHYRDAVVLIAGFDLSGDFDTLDVEFSAEMLDQTAFGDSTRIMKGGLAVASVAGSGHYSNGKNGVADALFGLVGDDDELITVFANGITEGTSTDMGFAMKGVVETFNLGETVGALLGFDFAMRGMGIG